MNIKNPKIDAVSVEHATDMARMISEQSIKHALEWTTDYKKKDRLLKNQCKTCFYMRAGKIGGSAMCESNCGICDKTTMYGSTCVDKLCKECSKKYELCIFCGADLNLRPKRIFKI